MKISEIDRKSKISADSAFLLWAIGPKQKRRIGGIPRKGQFKATESDQSYLFYK